MGDNGELKVDRLPIIKARIKELEPMKDNDPSGVEGGKVRKELSDLYKEKIKLETHPQAPQEAPEDFKIAEIWIREGQLILDASPEFWIDKLRAIGVLEFCKKIVYDHNPPQHTQPKVSLVNKLGFKNFVNGIKKRF